MASKNSSQDKLAHFDGTNQITLTNGDEHKASNYADAREGAITDSTLQVVEEAAEIQQPTESRDIMLLSKMSVLALQENDSESKNFHARHSHIRTADSYILKTEQSSEQKINDTDSKGALSIDIDTTEEKKQKDCYQYEDRNRTVEHVNMDFSDGDDELESEKKSELNLSASNVPIPTPSLMLNYCHPSARPQIALRYKKDCRMWLWKSRAQVAARMEQNLEIRENRERLRRTNSRVSQ